VAEVDLYQIIILTSERGTPQQNKHIEFYERQIKLLKTIIFLQHSWTYLRLSTKYGILDSYRSYDCFFLLIISLYSNPTGERNSQFGCAARKCPGVTVIPAINWWPGNLNRIYNSNICWRYCSISHGQWSRHWQNGNNWEWLCRIEE
jgi:hypothetical protein